MSDDEDEVGRRTVNERRWGSNLRLATCRPRSTVRRIDGRELLVRNRDDLLIGFAQVADGEDVASVYTPIPSHRKPPGSYECQFHCCSIEDECFLLGHSHFHSRDYRFPSLWSQTCQTSHCSRFSFVVPSVVIFRVSMLFRTNSSQRAERRSKDFSDGSNLNFLAPDTHMAAPGMRLQHELPLQHRQAAASPQVTPTEKHQVNVDRLDLRMKITTIRRTNRIRIRRRPSRSTMRWVRRSTKRRIRTLTIRKCIEICPSRPKSKSSSNTSTGKHFPLSGFAVRTSRFRQISTSRHRSGDQVETVHSGIRSSDRRYRRIFESSSTRWKGRCARFNGPGRTVVATEWSSRSQSPNALHVGQTDDHGVALGTSSDGKRFRFDRKMFLERSKRSECR